MKRLLVLLVAVMIAAQGCSYLPIKNPLVRSSAKPSSPENPSVVENKGQQVRVPGKLVFVRGGNLWMMEDGVSRQLTQGGKDMQPSWSPDGTVIAYVRRDTSYSDINLYVVSTGDFKPLTNNRNAKSTWVYRPQWSPDASQLAFVSDQFSWDMSLHVMNANGSGNRRLGLDGQGGVDNPTWAPDGKSLAAAAFKGTKQQIQLYTIQTGRWTQLTTHADGAYDPRWSPVDTKIAYAARTGKKTDIYVMNTDGSSPKQLTTSGSARAPSWSPDGQYLAWISEDGPAFDIYVAAVERGVEGEITLGKPSRLTESFNVDATSGISWLG